MGYKLWVILLVVIGMLLTVSKRQIQERENLAYYALVEEQTVPAQTIEPLQKNILPCVLDSGLIAEELVEYNGPFVEDGTGTLVSGITALMLYNSGSRDISFAMVAVNQGNRVLHFFITWLPAGESALVLEHDRALYATEPVTNCRSEGIRWEHFYTAGESVSVVQSGCMALTVTNHSAHTAEGVRLRYKIYAENEDFYLGGIAYSVYVGELASGESRVVTPPHDTAENIKVVAVLTQ